MPPTAATLPVPQESAATHAIAEEARRGLTSIPKNLAPWLFYDEAGSRLFEKITALPEYYLTRIERDIFSAHAADIFAMLGCGPSPAVSARTVPISARPLSIVELGAGTASKTGILLRALTRVQTSVVYQPIDISPTALDEAREQIERSIPGVTVRPHTANYINQAIPIDRKPRTRVLALYIGSSIGNFSPGEARGILSRLRAQLHPGDALLLGTDLAPGRSKSVATLLAAYNDTTGVTAAFNRNILARLNRELGANFRPECFVHRALWNPAHSRIEMHLESLAPQTVEIPANSAGGELNLRFRLAESIHTENSYKFNSNSIASLLSASAFAPMRTFTDPQNLFAVTLAEAI